MAKRGQYFPGMFDDAPQSPAEAFVRAGAPADIAITDNVNYDSNGEAIQPWRPKGEEDLGKPGKKTVEGEDLEFSPDPPQTAGGAGPNMRRPFGRFKKDTI